MKYLLNITSLLLFAFYAPFSLCKDSVSYISYYHDIPYFEKLLELALAKTQETYGDYDISITQKMVIDRSLERLSKGSHPNSVRMLLPQPRVNKVENIVPVPFPLNLGVFGYRVCFHADALTADLTKVSSLRELKRYSFAQGGGWVDAKILRSNGFDVAEIGIDEIGLQRAISTIYTEIASGKYDLFCRSASELITEKRYFNIHKNIRLNQTITVYYPLPFFFT